MDRILKDHQIVVDIPHGEAWLRDDEERPVDSHRGRQLPSLCAPDFADGAGA